MTSAESSAVTRIARRRALPGHEQQYETLVRQMLEMMKRHHGFLGSAMIPPEVDGGAYQVVVNFASEADLAAWDSSRERRNMFRQMRGHVEGELEHRRLDVLQEWFVGPSMPADARPPKWKTGVVSWMGIWPLASLAIFLIPIWQELGLPYLAVTAITVALVVGFMTYLVAPVLTKLMKWFLMPSAT